MKALFAPALALLAAALPAATPFAKNLKGLQYVILEINGDKDTARKAGYPFDDIRKDLRGILEKAGLKVVKSGNDVPDGKKALPAELILGMVTQNGLYSYALTFQAYEPMRIDGKDRVYVAWTSMLYGFGEQKGVKGQVKDQAAALVKGFCSDFKSAKR